MTSSPSVVESWRTAVLRHGTKVTTVTSLDTRETVYVAAPVPDDVWRPLLSKYANVFTVIVTGAGGVVNQYVTESRYSEPSNTPEDVARSERDFAALQEKAQPRLLFCPSRLMTERAPEALTATRWSSGGSRVVLVPPQRFGSNGTVMLVKRTAEESPARRTKYCVAIDDVLLWTDEHAGVVVELSGVTRNEALGNLRGSWERALAEGMMRSESIGGAKRPMDEPEFTLLEVLLRENKDLRPACSFSREAWEWVQLFVVPPPPLPPSLQPPAAAGMLPRSAQPAAELLRIEPPQGAPLSLGHLQDSVIVEHTTGQMTAGPRQLRNRAPAAKENLESAAEVSPSAEPPPKTTPAKTTPAKTTPVKRPISGDAEEGRSSKKLTTSDTYDGKKVKDAEDRWVYKDGKKLKVGSNLRDCAKEYGAPRDRFCALVQRKPWHGTLETSFTDDSGVTWSVEPPAAAAGERAKSPPLPNSEERRVYKDGTFLQVGSNLKKFASSHKAPRDRLSALVQGNAWNGTKESSFTDDNGATWSRNPPAAASGKRDTLPASNPQSDGSRPEKRAKTTVPSSPKSTKNNEERWVYKDGEKLPVGTSFQKFIDAHKISPRDRFVALVNRKPWNGTVETSFKDKNGVTWSVEPSAAGKKSTAPSPKSANDERWVYKGGKKLKVGALKQFVSAHKISPRDRFVALIQQKKWRGTVEKSFQDSNGVTWSVEPSVEGAQGGHDDGSQGEGSQGGHDDGSQSEGPQSGQENETQEDEDDIVLDQDGGPEVDETQADSEGGAQSDQEGDNAEDSQEALRVYKDTALLDVGRDLGAFCRTHSVPEDRLRALLSGTDHEPFAHEGVTWSRPSGTTRQSAQEKLDGPEELGDRTLSFRLADECKQSWDLPISTIEATLAERRVRYAKEDFPFLSTLKYTLSGLPTDTLNAYCEAAGVKHECDLDMKIDRFVKSRKGEEALEILKEFAKQDLVQKLTAGCKGSQNLPLAIKRQRFSDNNVEFKNADRPEMVTLKYILADLKPEGRLKRFCQVAGVALGSNETRNGAIEKFVRSEVATAVLESLAQDGQPEAQDNSQPKTPQQQGAASGSADQTTAEQGSPDSDRTEKDV